MGGFNAAAFSADFDLINRGELQQIAIIEVDVSAVTKELELPLPMSCNALTIIRQVMDENGVIQISSPATIGMRINARNQKALVWSIAQGDIQGFVGTIVKAYYRVAVADPGKKVYFAALMACGLSNTQSVSGYNPPAGIIFGGK